VRSAGKPEAKVRGAAGLRPAGAAAAGRQAGAASRGAEPRQLHLVRAAPLVTKASDLVTKASA
jgi:hypothetical protein